MKKITITTIALIMILAMTMISFAGNNAANVGVVVDGKTVEFDGAVPYIDVEAGRTMVPVRFVSEAMGVNVGWDGNEQMVVLEKGDQIVQMIIGQKTYATKNQYGSVKETQMDVAPFIKKDAGRTIVPLRFVSEALGADVSWDGDTYTVHIATENKDVKETVYASEEEIDAFIDKNIENVTPEWKADARATLKGVLSYADEYIGKEFDYTDQEIISGYEIESYRGSQLFAIRSGNALPGQQYVFALDMPLAIDFRDEGQEARKLGIFAIHEIFQEDADIVLADVTTIRDWIDTEGHRTGVANGMAYDVSFDTASGLAVKFIKR